MILSTSHNFLFVHVPKTAGTALTEALRPFGVTDTRTLWRRVLRRLPIREHPSKAYFRKHETAADIRQKVGDDVFDRFHRFTVVRNPFDHAVSHYEYLKEFRSTRLAERFQAMSFADYLKYRTTAAGLLVPFFTVLPDQAHFLVDAKGRLLIDRVMRFETLARDFDGLRQQIGLPTAELRRLNPTKAKAKPRSLASYYDASTLDAVRCLYARDFALFEYSKDLPD